MPLFLLIRHGENDYVKKGFLAGRTPGVNLNKAGQEQARLLAEKLAAAPIKAIYSSPLERALQTAEPLAKALGVEVSLRPGLTEVEVGDWTGMKLNRLRSQKLWNVVQFSPSRMQFPGGETFAQAQYRICQELEVLSKQHEPMDLVICVTHADPIRLAVAYFVGMPLDTFQRLAVAPASITALFLGEMGCQLLALNVPLKPDLKFLATIKPPKPKSKK